MSDRHAALEAEILAACDAGAWAEAAAIVVRGYGPEIFGLMIMLQRSESDAEEAFSSWSESVWKGLEAFRRKSSVRTWAYQIARHASLAVREKKDRDGRRQVNIDDRSERAELVAKVRTETRPYLRTEAKNKLAELKRELPEEEQMLLALRVDRDLPWNDVARIMLEDIEPSDEALKKEAAKLRKRFESIKTRLTKRGREVGMIKN